MSRGGDTPSDVQPATPLSPLEILVVDDEPTIREVIEDELRGRGHQVTSVADGAKALEAIINHVYDLVLCDIRLPKVDGIEILREVQRLAPKTDVILMTAFAAVPEAIVALKEGAADYLVKPFELDELFRRVDQVSHQRLLRNELRMARAWFSGPPGSPLIGRSPVMARLHDRIDKFAASDAPVLILGESGTGKELVATELHQRSARRTKPFVAVNCAAFPESLLESELFGHERGAFTGAIRKRDGRFKLADGGTLFLDEVAEIPLPAQAKLLRVLQEKSFEPLGASQKVTVDVRLISATHQNLKELIHQGRFREDLYYRLRSLELQVPPLRERRGDVLLLIEHFLRKLSPAAEGQSLSGPAMAALMSYPFPGNVRELEHAMQHAVALSGGRGTIELLHLPLEIARVEGSTAEDSSQNPQGLAEAVREFEREYLRRALQLAQGSRTRTAQMLGISRKSLWEKLRRHGLVDPDDEPTAEHPSLAGFGDKGGKKDS